MLNSFPFPRLRPLRRFEAAPAGDRESHVRASVLCIASGKGGTGKTVLATNLAVHFASRGERVLLVDFDAGLANAHLLLGLAPRYDLGHVVEGQVDARAAMVEGPERIRLLSGGVGRTTLVQPTRRELDRLFRALRPLENDFDRVIVDHGAGLGYGTLAHLAATRTLLVVTGHEVTALSDAYALYKRTTALNPSVRAGLVVNRSPDAQLADSAWERFRSAAQRFLGHGPEYLGWIPADPAVQRSVQRRVPVVLGEPESPTALAVPELAAWAGVDQGRTSSAFYERARRALR